MPRFKRKGRSTGIRFPQGFRVDGNGVLKIEGPIKNVTMQTERVHPSTSEIGIGTFVEAGGHIKASGDRYGGLE